MIPYSFSHQSFIVIDRALSDLKRALPIQWIETDTDTNIQHKWALWAAESISASEWSWFMNHIHPYTSLYLSNPRRQYLEQHYQETIPHGIKLPETLEMLNLLICSPEINIPVLSFQPDNTRKILAEPHYQSALTLCKLGEMLPAFIACPVDKLPKEMQNDFPWHHVTKNAVDHYHHTRDYDLSLISQAPLHLHEINQHAHIYAFRTLQGDKEHYAITIGNITPNTINPNHPPLVRVHSSCYTGDLFGSLRCDCQEQFHSALLRMSEHPNGGILLYLLQEGRGIGLANKLRTYDLQEQGYDTVDANHLIGFDDDERPFIPAVRLLEWFGCHNIELLTNNPRKGEELSRHGIHIHALIPHIMNTNPLNEHYLKTKAVRMRHHLPPL
jgi:GTP cyclohydrolase II